MTDLKYPLGTGAAGTALIVAMLLGAGGYFGYAGWAGLAEPVSIGGREVLGREGVRIGLYAAAALMAGAGLILALRSLRNAGREKFVALDANRLVISGFGLDGAERAIAFGEIIRIDEYRVRGMPVVEIVPRSGAKVLLGAVLFRSTEAFDQFRQELRARTPGLHG